ncbi:alpha/beta fold hydrolase [Oricola sp.]|uniref:alpha/beta fold hydrolase n=1 Tax=Oricola sp. TaxID=1979950 RepID=UPI0025DCB754|nr:alpha/beta fold hydrolase [Oricola sp.]MCI5074397.1 alpha/beta fold hydrolase [Oricola sp.]
MAARSDPASNDNLLAWSEAGSGDGDALVLLHGFGGSGRSYDPVLGGLDPSIRVILPDLPGHGRSFASGGSRHPRAAAAAVLATLDRIGCDRFHLGGFSMGGAVACLLALQAPERVASLTLLAPGGFGPQIAAQTLRDFAAARSRTELRAALSAMFAPGAPIPEAALDCLEEERANAALVAELVAIAALITPEMRQGEIPREMLGRIACPVQLVWGSADPVLPVTQSEGLAPQFSCRVIEGAGHMLTDEASDAVAATLNAAIAG